MTTSFDLRFTRPEEWLAELALDVAQEAVEGGIVRLAITHGPATIAQLDPRRPTDHRHAHPAGTTAATGQDARTAHNRSCLRPADALRTG